MDAPFVVGAPKTGHLRKRQGFLKTSASKPADTAVAESATGPADALRFASTAASSNGEGRKRGNSSIAARSFGNDYAATLFVFSGGLYCKIAGDRD